ncbi:putative L-ascorbate peroxidase 4, peroxisomal [Apium graveolens]|uniref:putative L-ascorbate peroxidase 4, peroxisomal n=1 Tax=Apium graveolens TaxID=4045 RepID=UPI003D79942D
MTCEEISEIGQQEPYSYDPPKGPVEDKLVPALVASKGHLLSDGIIRQGYCCIIWGHTPGKAYADRSGFDGAWTKEPLKYLSAMLFCIHIRKV